MVKARRPKTIVSEERIQTNASVKSPSLGEQVLGDMHPANSLLGANWSQS